MQINTGSPLEHHWVLASASVVPVASKCTCGSSGLPVWSVQWYPSALTESGLEVIRSGHSPACDPLGIQLVWWELFELNWFHLTCNPKYTKKQSQCWYQRHAQSDVEVLTCVKSGTGIHCRAVHSKWRLNLQRPVHLLTGVPPSCHFKLALMLLCLTLCIWACVGCHSPSSGIPV